MFEERNWTVEICLAFDVNAASADQALGAVLPLVSLGKDRYGPQPRIADYTVREHAVESHRASADDKLHGLTKAVYTAKEVAAILHVSLYTVYSRVPSMTIGGSRRYTRAAVLNVLEHGVSRDSEPQTPARAVYDRPMRAVKPAKVVRLKRDKSETPFLSVKSAAELLRISPYKLRQLLDEKKIYYNGEGRQRFIPREAIENYTKGLPPRAFVEQRIAEARVDPSWKGQLEDLEVAAANWLSQWPEA